MIWRCRLSSLCVDLCSWARDLCEFNPCRPRACRQSCCVWTCLLLLASFVCYFAFWLSWGRGLCVCFFLLVFVLFYFLRETKKNKVRLLSKWGGGSWRNWKKKNIIWIYDMKKLLSFKTIKSLAVQPSPRARVVLGLLRGCWPGCCPRPRVEEAAWSLPCWGRMAVLTGVTDCNFGVDGPGFKGEPVDAVSWSQVQAVCPNVVYWTNKVKHYFLPGFYFGNVGFNC